MLSVPQVSKYLSQQHLRALGNLGRHFIPRVGWGGRAEGAQSPWVTIETGGVRGWCIGRKVPWENPSPNHCQSDLLDFLAPQKPRSCGSGRRSYLKSVTPLFWKNWSTLMTEPQPSMKQAPIHCRTLHPSPPRLFPQNRLLYYQSSREMLSLGSWTCLGAE